ncbi:hypothetical protein [Petrimonas sp.]|uniref:hypothetical protein n=1 Tax=Petrimonas sp. TaxID=2023866 RepID=UPI002FC966AF
MISRIDQVRDISIFCCMTRLAFSDVKMLIAEHVVKNDSGNYWIRKKRQKTKNMCNIPLIGRSIDYDYFTYLPLFSLTDNEALAIPKTTRTLKYFHNFFRPPSSALYSILVG